MKRLEVLERIREQQLSANKKYFNKGIFPSFRKNNTLKLLHPDDNIFFSASILFILKSHENQISQEEKVIISEIKEDLLPNIHSYSNKSDRESFNFWQKKPHKHFPNGILAHQLKKFILPDDIDTSSLIHLILNSDKTTIESLRTSMANHANLVKHKIKTGHKCLRNLKGYSTWFGENMPIEFDVCVLCNYLLLLYKHNLKLNPHDLETVELIKETVNNSLYLKNPFLSAPEYPKKEIIIYHLARTISVSPQLESLNAKLTNDIIQLSQSTRNNFKKLLLSSSLLRLNHDIKPVTIEYDKALLLIESNWWFTAGFLSVFSNSILQKLAPLPLFHFRFYCKALNLCLLWENMILSKYSQTI